MYKLNLKRIKDLEKKYSKSKVITNILMDMVNWYMNIDTNNISENNKIKILIDLKILKKIKNNK
jgi:hypothetical protein